MLLLQAVVLNAETLEHGRRHWVRVRRVVGAERMADGWEAQRTVGLHSSGGMGMQMGGSDVLGDPLLAGAAASDGGAKIVVSDKGREPTAGIISSCISYCNSVIGAGILGLPFAFSRTGWAWGCILLCINTVLCTATMAMLENCMRKTNSSKCSAALPI